MGYRDRSANKRAFIVLAFLLMLAVFGICQAGEPAISKSDVLKRLEELKKMEAQLTANLQAVGGAIQDCEFWLKEMDERAKPKPKPEPEPKNEKQPN